MGELKFKGLNSEDNLAWMLKRKHKKIKLIDMQEYVGCTYNLISMWENEKAPMAQDKIERYKKYIEYYPEKPVD